MAADTTCVERVLSVEGDLVGTFISQHVRAQTLSRLMRDLNTALLDGDARCRERAEQAILHLGFPLDQGMSS